MAIDCAKFLGRTTFIIGAGKNVGKTTFLKHALALLRAEGRRVAFLGTGADGEAADTLTGRPKPAVWAEEGDCVVTAESALASSGASFSMLEVFPGRTIFGRQVLARAARGGSVELAGPASNSELARILAHLHAETSAEAVLVDGAADRVTPAGSGRRAGYVLVARVTPANIGWAAARLRLAFLLDKLPRAASVPPGAARVGGALTARRVEQLPRRCEKLVLDDFTKVFIGFGAMKRLCSACEVSFRETFNLVACVVITEDVEEDEVLRALALDGDGGRVAFNPFAE